MINSMRHTPLRFRANRLLLILIILFTVNAFPQSGYEPTNAAPGEFSRIGFLPRNIALGNAVSAVTTGALSSFYNPASAVFQEGNSFQVASTFLSLDRSLNYLSFTRKFEFFSSKDTVEPRQPRAVAGISAGVIHSGVSDIDGRDNQGFKTGPLSTMENLYFVSLSNRFSKKIALGFTVKIYHYRLYDKISATATGFDAGVIYRVNDNLTASAVLCDLNAKYKWDTSPVYGTDGTTTADKFPTTKRLGISYQRPLGGETSALFSGEFEANSYGRKIVRFGAEVSYGSLLTLRGGVDNYAIGSSELELPLPSGGFAVRQTVAGLDVSIEYTFSREEYARSDRHVFGLNINF